MNTLTGLTFEDGLVPGHQVRYIMKHGISPGRKEIPVSVAVSQGQPSKARHTWKDVYTYTYIYNWYVLYHSVLKREDRVGLKLNNKTVITFPN